MCYWAFPSKALTIVRCVFIFPILVSWAVDSYLHFHAHTFDRRKSHYGKTDEWKDFVQVTGGGNCTIAAARAAMGIDWMSKNEINESIPPVYTEYVGQELLRHLSLVEQEPVKAWKSA